MLIKELSQILIKFIEKGVIMETTSVASTTQSVVNTNTSKETTKTATTASGEFKDFLLKSLSRSEAENVNEEELYSSIISKQLTKESPELGKYFDDKVASLKSSMARSDGYVPVEDVARHALMDAVTEGKLTKEKADQINGIAFESAQLDGNKDALYDGRGTTSAVAKLSEIMFNIEEQLSQVDAGTKTILARSIETPVNVGTTPGHQLSGSEASRLSLGEGSEKQIRFTWKHVASDGNLAILLPSRLRDIKSVAIYDAQGELLEKGDYAKRTNDDRAVFRFNEPGKEYGKDVDVKITLDNGEELVYHVDNGGERTYVPQDEYTKG